MRFRVRSLSIAVIAIAALTATSSWFIANAVFFNGESPKDTTVATPQETVEHFTVAVDGFDGEFPGWYELPDYQQRIDAIVAETEEGPVHFEEGYAESDIVGAWMCAWQADLAAAIEADDQRGIDFAASQLEGFYDLQAVRAGLWVDPDRSWYKRVVLTALDGDTGQLDAELVHCEGWLK